MVTMIEAKKDLKFNEEFVQLVEVLKEIAASQFRTALRKKDRFERFLTSFDSFFRMVDLVSAEHPFVTSRSDTVAVVMITSDEGFMGGLNTLVIEAAFRQLQGRPHKSIVVGGRGADTLKDMRKEYIAFPGIAPETQYEQALELKNFLVQGVNNGEFGPVLLSYPCPLSFTVIKPEVLLLLPCAQLFGEVEGELVSATQRVFVESRVSSIVEYLVEMWMTYKLCDIYEDSKLAELAARVQQLEKSYDTLSRQKKTLRNRFFRARREMVDKGMRETFTSTLIRRKARDG